MAAVLIGLVPSLIVAGLLLGPRQLAPLTSWLPVSEAEVSPRDPTQPPIDSAPYSWTNSADEVEILEAVFRHQFENNLLHRTNPACR
jgi:hypothetical protein